MLRYALFDLDNTLYPKSCGVMEAIAGRMNRFMVERLGISEQEAGALRTELLQTYGTTLNALRRQYAIDPAEFLDYVHDLPLEKLIHYNEPLDRMLAELPLKKIIFTNADAKHARRVLYRLKIMRHFEVIVDIHRLEFINKPDRRAYRKVMDVIAADPEECVLLEDFIINIRPARKLGMTTILVGDETNPDGAHHQIASITEFGSLLRRIE